MITLPTKARNRAMFRILTMPEGTWGAQSWTPLPVPEIISRLDGTRMPSTVAQGGYHVRSISRWCLPDEDRAEFYIDTGFINGTWVAPSTLTNTAVRIQVLDNETFPTGAGDLPSSGWKTVFVGTVIYSSNDRQVGNFSSGRTTFYCAGVMWRTRNWPLDRHSTDTANHAKGHPGYNTPLHGWFRKVLGNKGNGTASDPFADLSGTPDIHSYYATHAMPVDGAGTTTSKWTDSDTVRHALASSRAKGEPKITTNLSAGLFDGTYAWRVSPGDVCWDLLRRVCNRQRGRGGVFLDYVDSDSGLGPVQLVLTARAAMANSTTYDTVKVAGDMTLDQPMVIRGAEAGTDAIDVDLNGDHRVTDAGFRYDDRQSSVFDGVTVQGECIQVLCNLNFFGGSLAKRWSLADQESFRLIADDDVCNRKLPRWRHVWRRFGIPAGEDGGTPFGFTVTAESGGSAQSVNLRTDDGGGIESASAVPGLSSQMTLRVLPDLPVYEGWTYAGTHPVRYDGGKDYMPPARMSPVVLYKADTLAGSDWRWFPLTAAGFNIQVDDFGMYIVHPVEEATGVRLLATPGTTTGTVPAAAFTTIKQAADWVNGVTTTSGLDLNKLNTIVGVELGTRVSIYKHGGDTGADPYDQAGRRMTMTVNGIHLWLAAPGAIWEFDTTRAGTGNYAPGLKIPSTGNPAYVLRDDRNELSFIAALAWEYYGNVHNPGTWGLNDCGLMTQFATTEGNLIKYPMLGQLVGTVTYGGPQDAQMKAKLNTPITSIHYDHDTGETTWRTDYVSYDGSNQ